MKVIGSMQDKIVYIKQHSVFSTDGNNGRIWREEKHIRWLDEQKYLVSWWYSSFDHYNKIQRNGSTSIDGVELKKFWVPAYKKNVSFLRLIGNILFSMQVFLNLIKLKKEFNTVICAYPTPESSLAATLACLILKKNIIIDVRDKWPDALIRQNQVTIKYLFFKIYVNIINRFIYRYCKTYIGMSDGVLEKVKFGDSEKDKYQIVTIPNTHDSNILKIKKDVSTKKKVRLTFFGTLNSQFTLQPICNASKYLSLKYPELIITIIGSGERLDEYQRQFFDQKNIKFLGHLNHSELLEIASESFSFFCFYENPLIYENHFTNKFVEYLTLGKPFIHNLRASFTINNHEYTVGTSLNEVSLSEFVDVYFGNESTLENSKLLLNFDETKNKKMFLSVIKNCHIL